MGSSASNVLIMDSFSKVITFYQMLALQWFSSKRKNTIHCETVIFITLNVCSITALFYWIYRNPLLVIFSDNDQGYVVDYAKFLVMVFTYYSLFVESGFQASILRQVWNELEQFQHILPRAGWAAQQRDHFVVVACFVCYMSWWEITYAYCVSKTIRCTNFTMAFWVLFLLLHLRQLQILLYTDLVSFCLKTLNAELLWTIELSKGASRYGGVRSDGQICGNLHTIMDAFARTEHLVELLNQAFGYSFTIIKLINHIYLLTDTYWIVRGFIKGSVFDSLYLECCISSKFICLMINLYSNERILSERVRTQALLHRLDLSWQLRCKRGWRMVEHFLLKLQSSPPFAMTAFSMLRMDYGVMMAVCV
uniref:Gustatory receptor n=1 Tax=Anopheles culicifacies TaxID=139723 RepID=A0A182MFK3_9DIPT